MAHLLVTNDFPPKVGGIQSYLWELWRRLPPDRFSVLTPSSHSDAATFDAQQPFPVERLPVPVLLPTPGLVRHVDERAARMGADLVVLDPALPLGHIGPRLRTPYAVVVHGAEITVPSRIPGTSTLLASVLRGAAHVIAGGAYAADEVRRLAPYVALTSVPPGVDTERFHPLSDDERQKVRGSFGLPADAPIVMGLSRLVPRKGFDVLIGAAALLAPQRPDLIVAIAGVGRDRRRLERTAAYTGVPVRFLGRVGNDDLPRLLGAADVFCMPCRKRWGGLEQEGFGIVFMEAAACGIPQVAGRSGGAAEAVLDGQTGFVVDRPDDPVAVSRALSRLLDDANQRKAMGRAARQRAEHEFSYDRLARVLDDALLGVQGG